MARALIGGLLRQGWRTAQIVVSEPQPEARAALQQDLGVHCVASNAMAVVDADIWVLAVKPQVMAQVCTELAPQATGQAPLVVSIAAGITLASLRHWLGAAPRLVRCMPNTPALIGQGITGVHAEAGVSGAEREQVDHLLRAVGEVCWIVEESLMDAVTAVSGSGPAYFFALMEGLMAGAEAQGLDPATARALVLQTALGAAALACGSEASPAELRRRVTSPGGTTAAGLAVLEARGLHDAAIATIAAATRRGRELSATQD